MEKLNTNINVTDIKYKLDKIKKKKEKYYKQYIGCFNEEAELYKEILDYEGKFLKTNDETSKYIYCIKSNKPIKDYDGIWIFSIQGHGFSSYISDYIDNTYFEYDKLFEIEFRENNLEVLINTVKKSLVEITIDEYNNAFHKLNKEIAEVHDEVIKNLFE